MSALHFAVLSYSGVFGDRGEKSPAVWNGEFKPSKTSKGVMFLGEVQPTHQVGVQMDELPAARTTMMVSFDLLHDEVVEPKPENLLLVRTRPPTPVCRTRVPHLGAAPAPLARRPAPFPATPLEA